MVIESGRRLAPEAARLRDREAARRLRPGPMRRSPRTAHGGAAVTTARLRPSRLRTGRAPAPTRNRSVSRPWARCWARHRTCPRSSGGSRGASVPPPTSMPWAALRTRRSRGARRSRRSTPPATATSTWEPSRRPSAMPSRRASTRPSAAPSPSRRTRARRAPSSWPRRSGRRCARSRASSSARRRSSGRTAPGRRTSCGDARSWPT